jgi:hypothetical protein
MDNNNNSLFNEKQGTRFIRVWLNNIDYYVIKKTSPEDKLGDFEAKFFKYQDLNISSTEDKTNDYIIIPFKNLKLEKNP